MAEAVRAVLCTRTTTADVRLGATVSVRIGRDAADHLFLLFIHAISSENAYLLRIYLLYYIFT